MAETKKTVTKKNEETKSKEVKVAAKKLSDKDVIRVRSLVQNVHYSCPKTFDTFIWDTVGDEQEMTFEQLKIMKNRYGGYLTKKWLYPQNDQAIQKLGLSEVFSTKFDRDYDIELFFGNDADYAIKRLDFIDPKDEEYVIRKVKSATKDGKIQNIRILKALEEKFDIDLISEL